MKKPGHYGSLLISFCVVLISACSGKAPHLGETVTSVDNGDGVTVTQVDSRHLLPNGKIAGKESSLIEIKATVSSIDRARRLLVIETPQGDISEFIAGPEIQNFSQISAGDHVLVEYLVSVVFEVRKPTTDELSAAHKSLDVTARSQLGAMPAAGKGVARVKIGTIEKIEKTTGTITLNGLSADGPVQVVSKYPENLDYVKVGDTVVVTALEAMATSVVRVP